MKHILELHEGRCTRFVTQSTVEPFVALYITRISCSDSCQKAATPPPACSS